MPTSGRNATAPPTLQTARLILRPHRAEDLDACASMWGNPNVTQHIGGRPSTRRETWMRLLNYRGLWSLLGYGYWAVVERATGTFAGDVGFADFHRELVPSIDGIPEGGWVLDPAFHGPGYASAAVHAALAWIDANVAAPRTVCIVAPENIASIRVAEKAGYVEASRTTYHNQPTIVFARTRATNA
ncbi:MAG: GNAT family N-acetyltransferase [Candidatus Eremiobacteraeota bacterium]|nr:GNAT family N-acetyltransferase [Candidatus Eremiobacteraeota bacterium]